MRPTAAPGGWALPEPPVSPGTSVTARRTRGTKRAPREQRPTLQSAWKLMSLALFPRNLTSSVAGNGELQPAGDVSPPGLRPHRVKGGRPHPAPHFPVGACGRGVGRPLRSPCRVGRDREKEETCCGGRSPASPEREAGACGEPPDSPAGARTRTILGLGHVTTRWDEHWVLYVGKLNLNLKNVKKKEKKKSAQKMDAEVRLLDALMGQRRGRWMKSSLHQEPQGSAHAGRLHGAALAGLVGVPPPPPGANVRGCKLHRKQASWPRASPHKSRINRKELMVTSRWRRRPSAGGLSPASPVWGQRHALSPVRGTCPNTRPGPRESERRAS